MIAALTAPVASSPDVIEVLLVPVNEALGWLDQPPVALLCLLVLTGIVLMFAPSLPERDLA